MERDVSFTMVIYTMAIVVGSMHTFLCIFGYFIPVVTVLLVIGEMKRPVVSAKDKKNPNEPQKRCDFSIRAIAKIVNMGLIVLAFFNIFFDDLVFAGGMPAESTDTTEETPAEEEATRL